MERLTNNELRNIRKECEEVIDGVKGHYQNKKILECYNNIKGTEDDYLNYTMLMEVYEKSIVEMANRFYDNNDDLISKKTVLNYLEEELNNMSQPKKDKPIPIEARVGSILTIRTMCSFIKAM